MDRKQKRTSEKSQSCSPTWNGPRSKQRLPIRYLVAKVPYNIIIASKTNNNIILSGGANVDRGHDHGRKGDTGGEQGGNRAIQADCGRDY